MGDSGWTIDTLKEHYDRLLDARDEALRIQAAEYERRLDALNHAHEQAVEVQHTYLTQDKYTTERRSDATAAELAGERVDRRMTAIERWQARAAGVGLVLIPLAGVVGAVIVKVLGG